MSSRGREVIKALWDLDVGLWSFGTHDTSSQIDFYQIFNQILMKTDHNQN